MNNISQPLIRAQNITYTPLPDHRIVNDFSFDLHKGEILVIVGPSGAGKTTLLRILQRLDEPTSGTLFFQGKKFTDIHPTHLRRKIGYVFQEPALFDGDVESNLRIHEKLGFRKSPFDRKTLESTLYSVGIDRSFLSRDVEKLSTGERKRVAMARALLARPELLLLDEPTANLDPSSALKLLDTLRRLNDDGLSILAVLHQVEYARRIADRAILMIKGRAKETAPAKDFFYHPQNNETRLFLAGELKS